jgi:hypothetical protein
VEFLANENFPLASIRLLRIGNHKVERNFVHPTLKKPITISGNDSEDAKHYQEKAVEANIKEVQK